MSSAEPWYIVKLNDGSCEILPASQFTPDAVTENKGPATSEHWGPFESEELAIARRVGLIRSGKCQPK